MDEKEAIARAGFAPYNEGGETKVTKEFYLMDIGTRVGKAKQLMMQQMFVSDDDKYYHGQILDGILKDLTLYFNKIDKDGE